MSDFQKQTLKRYVRNFSKILCILTMDKSPKI